jgi:hypothetical protein
MTAPLAVLEDRQVDDELVHITTCHDENISLCGIDLTGVPWVLDDENECVVCVDFFESDVCCADAAFSTLILDEVQ